MVSTPVISQIERIWLQNKYHKTTVKFEKFLVETYFKTFNNTLEAFSKRKY